MKKINKNMFREYDIRGVYPSDLDEKFMSLYIDNLSRMADTGNLIDVNNMWFVNYSSTNSYGGSVYKDIIYHTPDCYVLYNIKDEIWDKYENEIKHMRDCKPIDMMVVDRQDILNKYEQFEANAMSLFSVSNNVDKDALFKYLKKNFVCDDGLLEQYWDTLLHKMSTDK